MKFYKMNARWPTLSSSGTTPERRGVNVIKLFYFVTEAGDLNKLECLPVAVFLS
jgi:hypothetical protein